MLRKTLRAAVIASTLLMFSQPAFAEEKDRGMLHPGDDKYEGLCGEHGGTKWQSPDGNNWGCGYKGGGGLMSDKDTGCLEETPSAIDNNKWGLLGLLGLIGLGGLVGRQRRERIVT